MEMPDGALPCSSWQLLPWLLPLVRVVCSPNVFHPAQLGPLQLWWQSPLACFRLSAQALRRCRRPAIRCRSFMLLVLWGRSWTQAPTSNTYNRLELCPVKATDCRTALSHVL